MVAFQFLPTIAIQLGLLVMTSAGWGYWVWLTFRVYEHPRRFGWLWCGFTGFAGNALFLQAFVYADLPLSYSAWYGLIVAVGGLVAMTWRWIGGEWLPSKCTRREIIFMAAVGGGALLLQGWALGRIGPDDYYGRGRYDLSTYVHTAQLLSDEPFSLEPENIGLRPWMMTGVVMKGTRITQSVVHGFLAVIAQTNSQQAYGALSVFFAAIPALAVFAVLRILSLGRVNAGLGALWAAWLPAVSHTHLENFFSQITVLFVFPVMAGTWLESRGVSRLAIASTVVLLAFLFGAYTEFLPLGWALLFCILLMTPGIALSRKAVCCIAMVAGAFVLNPYYSFISVEYIYEQVGQIRDPAFLAELARDSGTWRGFIHDFFDFAWLPETTCALITGMMALLYCCALGAGKRRSRFALGISLAPLGIVTVLLAAKELPKYPFAKFLASFSPLAVIILVLGIYFLCARLFRSSVRWARIASAGVLGLLATISAIGTWRQQQAVVANGYFLDQINTNSMRAARRFMAKNPRLTYIIDASNPLVAAWLSYDARGSDVYLRNSEIGDIGLYSEMFWCRRVPAGLRSFVQVDDRGVISVGELSPSPSLAVVNSRRVFSNGTNFIYGSDRPIDFVVDRHDQTHGDVRMVLEFTVSCPPPPNDGSAVLRWAFADQTGENVLTGQDVITVPLSLAPGRNRCTIAVTSAKSSRPLSYFIQKIDLSPHNRAHLGSR
ncbi:MAG: hypothetical protein ABI273_20185 [Lacunisphaera sp.]